MRCSVSAEIGAKRFARFATPAWGLFERGQIAPHDRAEADPIARSQASLRVQGEWDRRGLSPSDRLDAEVDRLRHRPPKALGVLRIGHRSRIVDRIDPSQRRLPDFGSASSKAITKLEISLRRQLSV